MSSVTITDAASNVITITPPDYGYESRVIISMRQSPKRLNGRWGWYDYGSAYDWRSCTAEFLLSAADANSLLETFRDEAKSRAYSVSMALPSGSGFYPFGPDKGDSGTFQIRLTDYPRNLGASETHRDYHRVRLSFVAESFPAYSVPSQTSSDAEGPITFGTITGLRWPDQYAKSSNEYAVNMQTAIDGTTYAQHAVTVADSYTTAIDFRLNQVNAANLINYIVGTMRGTSATVVWPAFGYMFGREWSSSGSEACKLLTNELAIKAPRYNTFDVDIPLFVIGTL